MRNTKLLKKAKRASKTLALQTRLLKSLRVKNKNPACWLKSAARARIGTTKTCRCASRRRPARRRCRAEARVVTALALSMDDAPLSLRASGACCG